MHILGIANGEPGGNSEILLKSALTAAQSVDPSLTISWVHMPSVSIPRNPKPLAGTQDISLGSIQGMASDEHIEDNVHDDRQALFNHILEADALIFSTPIYSHAPAGFLKAVLDRILGPFADATFAAKVLEGQKQGDPRFSKMKVDPRVLKPRVAGFMAVGGSSTPDQISLALPTLHLLTYPMHIKIVDQVVFQSCASPGSVLFREGGAPMKRAAVLGQNVASQMGKTFDGAEYLGSQSRSACPYCHMDKIDLFYDENKIGCVVCGAQGHLEVGEGGVIRPVWNENCGVSSISWTGKLLHVNDIEKAVMAESNDRAKMPDFEATREGWRNLKIPLAPLPSNQ